MRTDNFLVCFTSIHIDVTSRCRTYHIGVFVMARRIEQVDLRLLRVFMAVVEQGGFAQGQIELNINQSTLSSHMTELEGRLGVRLCERGRSGFALTEDGRMVYENAQRLFNQLDEFSSSVRSNAGRLVGDLEIACIDNLITCENFQLPAAIARFKSRNEAVRINLHVRSPAEVQHGVAHDLFHIGVSSHLKSSPQVEFTALCEHEHHLYCARSHSLFTAAGRPLRHAELKTWEMVKPKFRQAEALPRALRSMPRMTAAGFNIEAVAALVLSGKYLGFLPAHYARRWVDQHQMKAINPDSIVARLEIGVILKRNRTPKAVVQAFVDDLIAAHQ